MVDGIRMALAAVCGLGWTIAYVLAVRTGLRDKTYCIPLVALAMNICWEFQFVFFRSAEHMSGSNSEVGSAEVFIGVIWLIVDCGLLYTVFRFGPNEFPYLPRRVFYAGFVVVLGLAYAGIEVLSREFDDGDVVLTSFGMNVAMSGLFLAMLAVRQSSRGQSMGIAVAKFVGTTSTCVVWFFDTSVYPGPWLPYCTVACVLLDVAYIAALSAVLRRERESGRLAGDRPELRDIERNASL
ncbi:transmembrane-type terpene cyclase [Streptomyces buecherae]|uniref:transmembrane-type terpene cyclase n=1 Tax=Streptomyces buecherae TaxID=2763006 RepID=UPI0036553B06